MESQVYYYPFGGILVECLEPWYRAYWVSYDPIKRLWFIVTKDNFGNVLDYFYV